MAEEPTGDDSPASTRERLLETAIRAFGQCGYDAVSTRALAEAAGANQAAIPYHFASKEGLYLAAAQYVVDKVGSSLKQMAQEVSALLGGDAEVPRQEVLVLLERVLGTLTRVSTKNSGEDSICGFMMREQLRPGPAFDIIYEGYVLILHQVVTRLVARLEDMSEADPSIIIRAHGLIGQALFFTIGRATFLRRMGWDEYTPERIDQVVSIVDGWREREFGGATPGDTQARLGADGRAQSPRPAERSEGA